MKLTDVAGSIEILPEEAKLFVQSWFKPDDKVCLIAKRSERTESLNIIAQSFLAREFITELTEDLLHDLIFDNEGNNWNLYLQVSPIIEDVTLKRRGPESNVSYVPGVWADIDVQPGGFDSTDQIMDWLESLDLKPTIVCSSGSSGVHAYWRYRWDLEGTKELVENWWSYLDEKAGDKSIDKLIDIARMLRIPGTLRFPKPEDHKNTKISTSRIILLEPDRLYTPEQIKTLSAPYQEIKNENRKKVRKKHTELRDDADQVVQELINSGANKWQIRQAISEVEDYVNANWDWNEILIPRGWRYKYTQADGSRVWARPGQSDKSAVTDYEGSPVMSLFSTNEATGLSDLLDANIALSKFTVALRLLFDDDYTAMVKHIIDSANQ